MGLEPTRPNGHMALNHACLPIPAPGRVFLMACKEKPISDYGKKVKRKIQFFCDLARASRYPPDSYRDKLLAKLLLELFFVIWLGLEPRTLSLKVRCSTN